MKLSKRQLKLIIREEKQRLQEMNVNAGVDIQEARFECVYNILMINSDSITEEEASMTAEDIIDALREEGLI